MPTGDHTNETSGDREPPVAGAPPISASAPGRGAAGRGATIVVILAVAGLTAAVTLHRLGDAPVCGPNEAVEAVFLQQMVEKGTLRTFGKDVAPVSAFFSAFMSILIYFMWNFVGRWFSTVRFLKGT